MESLNYFLKNKFKWIGGGALAVVISLTIFSLLVKADTTTLTTNATCVEPKQEDYDNCIAACGNADSALVTYNTCQTGCDSVHDLIEKSNCSNTCIGNWLKALSDNSDCVKKCLNESSERSAAYNACLKTQQTDQKKISKIDCSGTIKPVTLSTYTGSQLQGKDGKKVMVDADFIPVLDKINQIAADNGLILIITDSYSSPETEVKGVGDVTRVKKSNHNVGHAIDFKIKYYVTKWDKDHKMTKIEKICDYNCLMKYPKVPNAVKKFIKTLQDLEKKKFLRWGGNFKTTPKDPIHIDDGMNLWNKKKFNELYKNINCPAK